MNINGIKNQYNRVTDHLLIHNSKQIIQNYSKNNSAFEAQCKFVGQLRHQDVPDSIYLCNKAYLDT